MPELPPAPDDAGLARAGAGAPLRRVVVAVIDGLRAWVAGGDGGGEDGVGGGSGPSAWPTAGRRWWAVAGGALAVVVVAIVAWRAFGGGAAFAGGAPPELTMPRAGAGAGGGGQAGEGGASETSAAASSSSSGPSGGVDPAEGAGSSMVLVHVAGAVARPGLYRLGGSPRVADAVDAAGGPAADADVDALNLAAPVADGDRVYVARRGEVAPPLADGGRGAAAPTGPLDLNTATAEQLDALPGVGPSTAEAILDYRKEHGRFRSVDELLEVRGIGEAKLAELRSKVRVR